jgi:exosortase A
MTTLTLQTTRIPPAWRWPAAAILVYVLLLLLVFRDTAMAMVAIWQRSETFAHAFIVPPISLWLIWRQRHLLATLVPRPVPWMLLPLVLLGGLWWIGDRVSANAATQMMLAAMLVAGVPTLLGWRVAQAILFPLAFLFFAVPFGEFLTPVLMQYTADFTVAALRASGIPVYREGLQFVIPSGSWSVVEACSGIRYLMASFMVGSLFAYLNYRSWRRRLAFVAVSLVVPIVANWLRAYMIVMLGHLSGNTLAVGVDHLIYGWVFFGIVIMTMFFVGARWSEPDAPAPVVRPGTALAAGGAPAWWPVGLALVALLAVQAPQMLRGGDTRLSAKPAMVLPENLAAPWRADGRTLADWKPVYVAPAVELQSTYAAPSGRVGVYVAYYRDQSAASKLISSENVLVRNDDRQWHSLTAGPVELASAGTPSKWYGTTLQAAAEQIGQDKARLRVWHLYWIGDHVTSDEMAGKLLQAWQHLLGRPDDAAVIVLYALQPDTARQADVLLAQFAAANFGMIQRQLVQARTAR